MDARDLIVGSLEQSQRFLTNALDGLTQEEAAWSPGPECNSIAFILWHTVRVEDRLINGMIQRGTELYEAEGGKRYGGSLSFVITYLADDKLHVKLHVKQ